LVPPYKKKASSLYFVISELHCLTGAEKATNRERKHMSSLHIAILGAGDIGVTLGRKWARAGHTIAFGVKNPASEKAQ
jgi:hypothetical protein